MVRLKGKEEELEESHKREEMFRTQSSTMDWLQCDGKNYVIFHYTTTQKRHQI